MVTDGVTEMIKDPNSQYFIVENRTEVSGTGECHLDAQRGSFFLAQIPEHFPSAYRIERGEATPCSLLDAGKGLLGTSRLLARLAIEDGKRYGQDSEIFHSAAKRAIDLGRSARKIINYPYPTI